MTVAKGATTALDALAALLVDVLKYEVCYIADDTSDGNEQCVMMRAAERD